MPRPSHYERRHGSVGSVAISITKAERFKIQDPEELPLPRKQKPPHSRKLTTRHLAPEDHSTVTAVATADSYKFRELKRFFHSARGQILDVPDVVCLHFPAYGGDEETHAFVFEYGVTVWWGSDIIGRQILALIKPFEVNPEKEIDFEICEFSYNALVPPPGHLRLLVDHIYLENSSVELKLAFSHGLAQSAKLTIFEDRIENIFNSSDQLPKFLESGGTVKVSRSEAARLKGALFVHRMNINLHTDILVTPDYFWEHGNLKPVYVETRQYMDIDQRVDVLNQRLLIVEDMFSVLHQELGSRHLRHLEWVVLCLVLVNIMLAWVTLRNQLRHLRVFSVL